MSGLPPPSHLLWVPFKSIFLFQRLLSIRFSLYRKQVLIQIISPFIFLLFERNSDGFLFSYITFISTKFNVSQGIPYVGYSAFFRFVFIWNRLPDVEPLHFRLCGMSGSFDSPLPAATSSIPIPQSIKNPSTSSRTSTITVGTLSTSLSHPSSTPLPTPSVTSSVSGFSTSITQSSSASLSTTSSAPATTPSNGCSSHLPRPLPVLFLALFSSFLFS